MSLDQKTVLGIPITVSKREYVLEEIVKGLKKVVGRWLLVVGKEGNVIAIFTPNPEIVMYAQKDQEFKRIVASAQINIPDGWGICWAIRRLFGMNVERISGVDFVRNLCELSKKHAFRIGLLGGRAGVALTAKECLREEFPRLEVEVIEVGEIEVSGIRKKEEPTLRMIPDTGYRIHVKNAQGKLVGEEYLRQIVEQIQQKDIRILFVALGFPKQEYLIAEIRDQLLEIGYDRPIVLMAVGGALDYISGAVPRAPLWMRERGGEWAYRLLREPSRLGRQVRGAEFFWRIFWLPK